MANKQVNVVVTESLNNITRQSGTDAVTVADDPQLLSSSPVTSKGSLLSVARSWFRASFASSSSFPFPFLLFPRSASRSFFSLSFFLFLSSPSRTYPTARPGCLRRSQSQTPLLSLVLKVHPSNNRTPLTDSRGIAVSATLARALS